MPSLLQILSMWEQRSWCRKRCHWPCFWQKDAAYYSSWTWHYRMPRRFCCCWIWMHRPRRLCRPRLNNEGRSSSVVLVSRPLSPWLTEQIDSMAVSHCGLSSYCRYYVMLGLPFACYCNILLLDDVRAAKRSVAILVIAMGYKFKHGIFTDLTWNN